VPLTDEIVAHVPDSGPAFDPAEQVDFDRRIHTLLQDLSPMQRACFRLSEIEGFSRGEVAEMLGVNVATVRVHVHRARQILQSMLRT